MNKIAHVVFSTIIFIFLYIVFSNNLNKDISKLALAYYAVFIVYSLLPDIDKNNSWIRKKFDVIVIFLIVIFTIISIVYQNKIAMVVAGALVVVEIFLTFVKHRGVIHTIGFGIVISLPLLFLNEIFFVSGLIGFITHLIADKI